MFVAHAAAITEVWLALIEHGPAAGIKVTGWLTDRAGWQEWTRVGRWSSHPSRLTPDAVSTFTYDGAEAVAFVEVDLASMTQTVLKQKVARYLAYADDLAWQDRHPYCPPMLLLTTTQTRAVSFLRAAGQVIEKHRRSADPHDRAATLVVAACGLVRDPGNAVAQVCWGLPDDSVADLTLAEVLVERAAAKDASDAWLYERDVVQRRRDDIEALRSVAGASALADWLGSEPAAQVLRLLIGADPGAFMDQNPSLAGQVAEWFDRRRRVGRFQARDLAQPLVTALEERHDVMWQQQAHRVLAAEADIADEHPRLCRLAAGLAEGHLVDAAAIAALDQPAEQTRAEIQQRLLGDYHDERTAAITKAWTSLPRRERRRTSVGELTEAYDAQRLLSCELCALVYPRRGGDADRDHCEFDGRVLAEGAQRPVVPSTAEHLEAVRGRLDNATPLQKMGHRGRLNDQAA